MGEGGLGVVFYSKFLFLGSYLCCLGSFAGLWSLLEGLGTRQPKQLTGNNLKRKIVFKQRLMF